MQPTLWTTWMSRRATPATLRLSTGCGLLHPPRYPCNSLPNDLSLLSLLHGSPCLTQDVGYSRLLSPTTWMLSGAELRHGRQDIQVICLLPSHEVCIAFSTNLLQHSLRSCNCKQDVRMKGPPKVGDMVDVRKEGGWWEATVTAIRPEQQELRVRMCHSRQKPLKCGWEDVRPTLVWTGGAFQRAGEPAEEAAGDQSLCWR